MKAPRTITHEFVDSVPAYREEGKLYISLKYRTAIHSCFCGCGNKVITPIRPTKWRLLFDGDTVSLFPSVGNWSYPCRSHYVIRGGRAIPAGNMSEEAIEKGRSRDRTAEDVYFSLGSEPLSSSEPPVAAAAQPPGGRKRSFWDWLMGR